MVQTASGVLCVGQGVVRVGGSPIAVGIKMRMSHSRRPDADDG